MTALFQDFKYAIRGLVKSPGFAAISIATLALGIGANAAIFALVNRVLLTRLPVRDPDELVLLRSQGPIQGHGWSDADIATSFTYPMYRDLSDGNTVFAGLIATFPFDASVAARGGTERANADLVSGNTFDVLGVVPALGRVLTADDDRQPGAHPVTVLSYGYWSRRFASDPAILNTTIVVNGHPLTVVGVSRKGFTGVQPGRQADLFVPAMEKAQMTPFWNGLDDPRDYWIQLVGRLKPGLTREAAQAGIAPLYRSLLDVEAPKLKGDAKLQQRFREKKLDLLQGSTGRAVMRDSIGKPLVSLMAMVALVLVIACSNLAGLLAARGAVRQREYGIRLAIGASQGQLLRQSVVECLVFSLAGGALGLAVAAWTLEALLSTFPADADVRVLAVQIDPRVIVFAGALSLLSALFFGLAPTWRAARLDPAGTLTGSGRGSSAGRDALRFRQWLVTAQVALTLVLLVAAGFFVRTLQNLGNVELGLKPDHVIGFTVAPRLNGYTAERTAQLGRELTDRLSALPGVQLVSSAELPTLANEDSGSNITVEGMPEGAGDTHVNRNEVGPGYFAALGIPLIAGRELAWRDDAAAPRVAIVNQSLVRQFLPPGRNPIGARLALGGGTGTKLDTEIVGVVADSKSVSVDEKSRSFLYRPWQQDAKLGQLTFYVRSAADPTGLTRSIRESVRGLDPQLPIFDVKTLETQIRESLSSRRLMTALSAAFGALAALLAALGIYGVLAFGIAQRKREIGVRIALGATPGDVRRLVLSEVGRFLLIGALIGLPAAYALGRAVQSILFGVKASDLPIFAAGLALLGIVALAAAYPPARRAARTNAMEALRSE